METYLLNILESGTRKGTRTLVTGRKGRQALCSIYKGERHTKRVKTLIDLGM